MKKAITQFYKTKTCEHGFTLMEVIAILIIIGITLAVAMNRVISTQSELISELDIVKSHLRYVQLKALNSDTGTWGISFSANSYTLQYNGAAATISLPSEDSNTHTFSSGVTMTGSQTVTYTSWGSPGAANVSLTLSQGGETRTTTITAGTGFISP